MIENYFYNIMKIFLFFMKIRIVYKMLNEKLNYSSEITCNEIFIIENSLLPNYTIMY